MKQDGANGGALRPPPANGKATGRKSTVRSKVKSSTDEHEAVLAMAGAPAVDSPISNVKFAQDVEFNAPLSPDDQPGVLDRRKLLFALQLVRSGDFSVQLPGDWSGVDVHSSVN